jgi:CheY-like chemotaxis protein
MALELAPDLPAAMADPNQLEMALLNLAVNSRDAMPNGGMLTIEGRLETLPSADDQALEPGAYVRLSVRDTGIGMDEDTRRHATEPFFSTKGIGRGTGLGLSMVHGLAAQLGGGIALESSPGEGATIKIWLPVADHAAAAPTPRTDPVVSHGSGTVLLVDDEDLVRASTAYMLTDLGYHVIEAKNAEEALRKMDEESAVDLLVTDHLMPGMTGADLSRTVARRWPDIPVLLISGYAESGGVGLEFTRLTKPFRQSDLAAILAELTGNLGL